LVNDGTNIYLNTVLCKTKYYFNTRL